jgi:IS5 family transposase
VFDRSSLTRWRQRMGEEKLQALLQESLSVATETKAIKPSDLNRVIVDTTVQPKNVMFPTDARLLNRARETLVRLAKRYGVKLRQSYARVGKFALIKHEQARQQSLEEAQNLSRPRHSRHRPQTRWQRRLARWGRVGAHAGAGATSA